jgi:ABC-2 type transport system ATP-binding protein
MMRIENLTKAYRSRTVVDGLTFEVRPGAVTGFLGPNGAGKSTTLRMVLGLERPSAGRAVFDGTPYRDLVRPLTVVGALLDAGWVHPRRTARAHLRWMAASNAIDERRVDEVLELVGLRDVAGQRVGGFSLGMRQRLGLAAALLGDPQYLLLDEPVNGLDPEGIVWIRRIMQRLAAQGRTVLVSSHLLSEMAQTAEHLVVIAQGRLVADTTVREFVAESTTGGVRVRGRDLRRTAEVLARAGADVQQEDGGQALRVGGLSAERVGEVAAAAGLVLFEISEDSGSLEEAFMRRTEDALSYRGALTGAVAR